MRIDVLTLFPEVFETFVRTSIVGRAVSAGLVDIGFTNIRDFASDAHRSVDDKPFGGGPGMVLMCGPVFDAVEQVDPPAETRATRILLTPQGRPLVQQKVCSLAEQPHLLIICGHYEGFDERIRTGLGAEEISIGDYVLSGGEPAAMVLIDAVVRLQEGALGDKTSAWQDSFTDGLLEAPQYTRPREFRTLKVPDVLLSGNHAKIAAWRYEQSIERTRQRRPDLLDKPRSNRPESSHEQE